MIDRFRAAARVLIKGDPRKTRRSQIPTLTPEEIGEIKGFFPREKFFIIGHARSGTTLLTRLVRLHPEVHCNYQAHFFTRRPLLRSVVETREVEEWLTRRSNRWNHGRDLSPLVLRVIADFIMEREAVSEGKRIVGDKSPSSNIHGQAVRDLHTVYPDAKVVYIVRDGRDVLISERFRNFVEESRFLSPEDQNIVRRLRKNRKAFGNGKLSIFTEGMLRRVVQGWATDVSEIDAEAKRLFGRHYLALRYEDLMESPVEELRRVWKFLGAKRGSAALERAVRVEMKSNPDEEWQASRNEEIASFLLKGKSGNWKQLFTARDKSVFKQLGGEMLIRWKYESSLDW